MPNCYDCKHYVCYGPSYYLNMPEIHICWKGVNIETCDSIPTIEDPETDKDCYTERPNKRNTCS